MYVQGLRSTVRFVRASYGTDVRSYHKLFEISWIHDSDFTRAIQLDSTYADAWEYRGISYSSFDKLAEARRDLERAAKLNPDAAKSLRRYVGSEGKTPIKALPARPASRPGPKRN